MAFSEITYRFIIGDYEILMSETSYPTTFEKITNGFGVSSLSPERLSRGETQYKRI